MTIKQTKFFHLYIKLGNATKAAMAVYDCKDEHSASVIGAENLVKLSIDDSIQAWCERLGATDRQLVSNLIDGTKANKVVSARITDKDANVDTDDFIDVPDWTNRLKANEILLKIKNRFPKENNVAIQINTLISEKRKEYELDEI